jgi:outer membrane scaffolding protein for murein synthesis (MipA/OmpV family)
VDGIPFRLRAGLTVTGDATGRTGGVAFVPSASLWVPLSPRVFVGAGALARFGTASQNRHFFGIAEAARQRAASRLSHRRPG